VSRQKAGAAKPQSIFLEVEARFPNFPATGIHPKSQDAQYGRPGCAAQARHLRQIKNSEEVLCTLR